jgi:hypothetical protein
MEKYWAVQNYPACQKHLGWGFGKLDVMMEPIRRRLLFIDADIVFAGKVIDRLESFDEDFVVHKEHHDAAGIQKHYFDPAKVVQLDPSFEFAGYGFNGGQIVATTGVLSKADFEGLVDWEARNVKHPDIFQMGDQGLTNYVVQKKAQKGELTIQREPFMVWPGQLSNTAHIRVDDFTPEGPHRELIHWAGLRWGKTISQMPRADILLHFETKYYDAVPLGRSRKAWRQTAARLARAARNRMQEVARPFRHPRLSKT